MDKLISDLESSKKKLEPGSINYFLKLKTLTTKLNVLRNQNYSIPKFGPKWHSRDPSPQKDIESLNMSSIPEKLFTTLSSYEKLRGKYKKNKLNF